MNRREQEKRIQWTWAGIILALFVARQTWYHTRPKSQPEWVSWEKVDLTIRSKATYSQSYPSSPSKPYRNRTQYTSSSQSTVSPTHVVATDTVSVSWITSNTNWPKWKAEQVIRTRERWGGIDSANLDPDWTRGNIQWVVKPISCLNLNEMSRDQMGNHPLIGWDRAKVLHQYRSRIRPFQSWEEVWALGIGDSASRVAWPNHFVLGNS